MPVTLQKDLRTQLSRTTLEARSKAEAAAQAALENLAVHEAAPRPHMNEEQRKLRNRLRARGRALGDTLHSDKTQDLQHLLELGAYEAWHRLLFTRFLTENNLLHTDEANGSVPVSLQECDELATEMGAADGFDLACRFAQGILPGVFRSDDPALELKLSIEDSVALRKLVLSIPMEVFQADDSLGWTYQFWQEQRKDAINKSGVKIGADELSPVTQLFTEDYMVEFLLHNTLGAWWAGKQGPIQAESEQQARDKVALSEKDGIAIEWTYLRFLEDETSKAWTPAAGTFEGWPKHAKEVTFLDPCMGSGHFLVFALPILARLRMEEEGLSAKEAIHAALQDNVHGLELDERCSQIAAFNLALTAWKLGGFQALPELHLACSGIAPHATKEEWAALAGSDSKLKNGMERLHDLFKDAPVLGSLINRRASVDDMYVADFLELQPLLEKALAQETQDDTAHEMAVTACGLGKAAEILDGQFTLVATNVPYLGGPKQDEVLKEYCERVHPKAKADLATCFVERSIEFCTVGGSTALVTPQNWLFLASYEALRTKLLQENSWDSVSRLGPKAFQTPMWDFNVMLIGISKVQPTLDNTFMGVEASSQKSSEDKSLELTSGKARTVQQAIQLKNPDARVTFDSSSELPLLSKHAYCFQGASMMDMERLRPCFWEIQHYEQQWDLHLSSPNGENVYTGCHYISATHDRHDINELADLLKREKRLGGWKSGRQLIGKRGVTVAWLGDLPTALYPGKPFDHSAAVIVPNDECHLEALWCFCSDPVFQREVRKIDQKAQVANTSFVKVPFDLAHWQKVAAEKYPQGLPKPFSSDPTQWLFNGHPAGADQPLHVAVARLLGYQWPRQTGSSFPDCPALGPDGLESHADSDGIVCLFSIHREQPAADRLRQLLTDALGRYDEKSLVQQAGLKGSKTSNLEDWLRDEFFEQHFTLFHHRPFIWHIWDGCKDGFHALVNYHKLDHATLKKLTFTYLGEWITKQDADTKADKPGAAERLGAAKFLQQQLEAILEGEAPLDIFVRWKPLHQQAIGWNPDLNDGVRLNIRPFLLADDVGKKGAGILRAKPNIKWDKDRGKEPERSKTDYPWFWIDDEPEETDPTPSPEFTGNRWNNVHLSLDRKRKAKN
jgi:hypothetical protein